MKPFLSLLFLPALLCAQSTFGVSRPRVGVLDYYGLHKISPARIQRVLATREGDPFPNSKGDVEERLEHIPGVVRSHLEAVCCDSGKPVLFVGIEEKGAAHFEFRSARSGIQSAPLPFPRFPQTGPVCRYRSRRLRGAIGRRQEYAPGAPPRRLWSWETDPLPGWQAHAGFERVRSCGDRSSRAPLPWVWRRRMWIGRIVRRVRRGVTGMASLRLRRAGQGG